MKKKNVSKQEKTSDIIASTNTCYKEYYFSDYCNQSYKHFADYKTEHEVGILGLRNPVGCTSSLAPFN